jgi:hypothetical protein
VTANRGNSEDRTWNIWIISLTYRYLWCIFAFAAIRLCESSNFGRYTYGRLWEMQTKVGRTPACVKTCNSQDTVSATWRKERSTVETNEIMKTAAQRSESWCWRQLLFLLSHVLMLVLTQLVCGRPNEVIISDSHAHVHWKYSAENVTLTRRYHPVILFHERYCTK